MKNLDEDSCEALEYAIKNISDGYVKCYEPEYEMQHNEKNFCKIQNLETFKLKKLGNI